MRACSCGDACQIAKAVSNCTFASESRISWCRVTPRSLAERPRWTSFLARGWEARKSSAAVSNWRFLMAATAFSCTSIQFGEGESVETGTAAGESAVDNTQSQSTARERMGVPPFWLSQADRIGVGRHLRPVRCTQGLRPVRRPGCFETAALYKCHESRGSRKPWLRKRRARLP